MRKKTGHKPSKLSNLHGLRIVTVRVVNDKRCFGNAAMAAERESGGGGWCKELRARDGACVRAEMRADERRAYVRVTGRAGG
jgi:hypothetical protein